jgi:hypothetical protein
MSRRSSSARDAVCGALSEQGGVSQEELAQHMSERGFGFTQATTWKIERGQRPIKISEAVALGKVLGLISWTHLTEASTRAPLRRSPKCQPPGWIPSGGTGGSARTGPRAGRDLLERAARQGAHQNAWAPIGHLQDPHDEFGGEGNDPNITKPQLDRGLPGACVGALGRIRTCNLLIRSQMLYPLSYEREYLVITDPQEARPCGGSGI